MNLQAVHAVKEFLTAHKWPIGLQEEYLRGMASTQAVYVVVDDSGSMSASDSTRFIKDGSKYKPVKCARYVELQVSFGNIDDGDSLTDDWLKILVVFLIILSP